MPAVLTIAPWPDPILDTVGYDPRSRYAETFWLPTLGPTALLLMRHLASRFELRLGPIELTGLGDVTSPRARRARRIEFANRAHTHATRAVRTRV